MLKGKRVLAIGAAGSIGSMTVKEMAAFAPAALHVIDLNENALAELVRQLRSAPEPLAVDDFRTIPLDFGAPVMEAFLTSEAPYDLVLNFAAVKHVRNEKDTFSLTHMLDTNIVKQARLRSWIAGHSPNADLFFVSTDKAANPVSFMGATKRVMEHVLFSGPGTDRLTGRLTSARFANVAFSNGSLLQSFENRLARGEPIAAPKGIRRYFVSLEESGQLCLLASCLVEGRRIAIPKLDPEQSLIELETVARSFIERHGYRPIVFEDEREACRAAAGLARSGEWPLLLTPANTSGEKPYEEFVGADERVEPTLLSELNAIPYEPQSIAAPLENALVALERVVSGAPASSGDLKAIIAGLEPAFEFNHIQSELNLDQRA